MRLLFSLNLATTQTNSGPGIGTTSMATVTYLTVDLQALEEKSLY